MKLDDCPACGHCGIVEVVKPHTFNHKGYGLTIPKTLSYECMNCEESFFDKEQQKEWEPLIEKFQNMINEKGG